MSGTGQWVQWVLWVQWADVRSAIHSSFPSLLPSSPQRTSPSPVLKLEVKLEAEPLALASLAPTRPGVVAFVVVAVAVGEKAGVELPHGLAEMGLWLGLGLGLAVAALGSVVVSVSGVVFVGAGVAFAATVPVSVPVSVPGDMGTVFWFVCLVALAKPHDIGDSAFRFPREAVPEPMTLSEAGLFAEAGAGAGADGDGGVGGSGPDPDLDPNSDTEPEPEPEPDPEVDEIELELVVEVGAPSLA